MKLDGIRVTIVAASWQNAFFEDLERAVAYTLRSLGAQVQRCVDHFPELDQNDVFIVVPHEYFALTGVPGHPSAAHHARTIGLATEQPGTSWFERTRELCAHFALTLDINQVGARALSASGIDATHLPLGYCPEWDEWHEDWEAERPTDVVFLGGFTDRRARGLARCGEALGRHRCDVRLSDNSIPLQAGAPGVIVGRDAARLYASSKVVLDVHRGAERYFEWHRMLVAIMNGAAVVAEHSVGSAPLIPGVDYASSSFESLPYVLELVLTDDSVRDALRRSALTRLKSELPGEETANILAAAVQRAVANPIPPGPHRASVPSPNRPPSPPDGRELVTEAPNDARRTNAALKLLIGEQRHLSRRIERLERPEEGEPSVSTFGDYDDARPEISVVLTVYNYAPVVADAIESVGRSTHPAFELVVVDDCSRDGSEVVVAEALARRPWIPAKLISLQRNRGLPFARNLGVEHSRGRFVFILDADNVVYPSALTTLETALRDDPEAAFAYGIIERFDSSGPVGLISWQAWDPARLRHQNYIDAMALLRRRVLLSVGGYTADPRLYGWEDFDLWCRLANEGMRGVFVPNIVARYRSHPLSMLEITGLDTSDAWSALVERYPYLSAGRD